MDSLEGKQWHSLTIDKIISTLETDMGKGLCASEAQRRTALFGRNALTARRKRSALKRFLLQFHQPLIYVLLFSSVISAVLGEMVNASVILGVVLVNAVVGYFQETKAVDALEVLARSMVAEAEVVRAGSVQRVDAAELVPGDIVLLRSGDRVPADLRLLAVKSLQVDESALTGESAAVSKGAEPLPSGTVLADRTNMTYASALVTYGTATGVVVATGDSTEIGRISTLVSEASELVTPLTSRIKKFTYLLLWVIIGFAALTFITGIARGEKIPEMFMAAVALAVGAIPEGLPAAVTVILAIGVSRMAARGAIIRNLPAVETLGEASVICSDKTGTLTENKMTVTALYAAGRRYVVKGNGYNPEGCIIHCNNAYSSSDCDETSALEYGNIKQMQALYVTLLAGALCNDTMIESGDDDYTVVGDPTEAALLVAAMKSGINIDDISRDIPRIDAIPFESEYQYMATLHNVAEGVVIYVKGSVESILNRSERMMLDDGNLVPLDSVTFRREAERMAMQGLRVLALAQKNNFSASGILTHEAMNKGLVVVGLQGMIDPPRPGVESAVAALQGAGVQVKMITGDHSITAAVIGRQIGLGDFQCPSDPACKVLTGAQLAGLTDEELALHATETSIFARVAPEQKLRLVMALQNKGEVVAMTGDGVNDAPALKRADIGIAMGRCGTEVAKEAADMVLTDDNFVTIRAAVEEGRGVYDNLLKFIVWTLPTNIGEGLIILVAVLLGIALPILPVQILWINMTTASILGITLAFEPMEQGLMRRKPRKPAHPIFDRELFRRVALVGALLLVSAFGLYQFELTQGQTQEVARTVAVNVFVMVQTLYLFNSRSFRRSPFEIGIMTNPWTLSGAIFMVLLQLVFTYAPFMNGLFKSAPIDSWAWIRILAVSVIAYLVVELDKKRHGKPR